MQEVEKLKKLAAKCRRNVLRMIESSGCGHLGGALSCLDIVTALYFHEMRVNPKEPDMYGRDRFILSAGHKCMAQYAVLAEKGYFEKNLLDTYGKLKTKLPGHPDMNKLSGVEANTGALGHGLAIGLGMAISAKIDQNGSRVFTVMGDGELAEGSNWEAIAAAAHHKVGNLVAIVDYNGLQISGQVEEIMNFTPIGKRFQAFGWNVMEIDGNDMQQIIEAFEAIDYNGEIPTVIVAHTIKGKGVSFAENQVSHHYWKSTEQSLKQAIIEVEAQIREA